MAYNLIFSSEGGGMVNAIFILYTYITHYPLKKFGFFIYKIYSLLMGQNNHHENSVYAYIERVGTSASSFLASIT